MKSHEISALGNSFCNKTYPIWLSGPRAFQSRSLGHEAGRPGHWPGKSDQWFTMVHHTPIAKLKIGNSNSQTVGTIITEPAYKYIYIIYINESMTIYDHHDHRYISWSSLTILAGRVSTRLGTGCPRYWPMKWNQKYRHVYTTNRTCERWNQDHDRTWISQIPNSLFVVRRFFYDFLRPWDGDWYFFKCR